MAKNKQVKQCRFYVDLLSYFHAVGYSDHFEDHQKYLYLDPSNPTVINGSHAAATTKSFLACGKLLEGESQEVIGLPKFKPNFIGILNHNLANNIPYIDSNKQYIALNYSDDASGLAATTTINSGSNLKCRNDINGSFSWANGGINFLPDKNGWSLTHINEEDDGSTIEPKDTGLNRRNYYQVGITYKNSSEYNTSATNPFDLNSTKLHIGSWVLGRYYETPHSPSMSLTMKREFDGVKKSRSTKGKQFVQIDYDGPQSWTQYLNPASVDENRITHKIPSMEFSYGGDTVFKNYNGKLYGEEYERKMAKHQLGQKGKRVWSLAFDYFSDTDMWIDTESSTNFYTNEALSDADPYKPADYSEQLDNFSFQWVWTHTLGGALPFLFCPDKNLLESTDSEDMKRVNENMVLSTFDNKTLQVRQVAPNLYNVSVSIREL